MTRRVKSFWPFGYGIFTYSNNASGYILATVLSADTEDEALALAIAMGRARKELISGKHPVFAMPLKQADRPHSFIAQTYKRIPNNATVITDE